MALVKTSEEALERLQTIKRMHTPADGHDDAAYAKEVLRSMTEHADFGHPRQEWAIGHDSSFDSVMYFIGIVNSQGTHAQKEDPDFKIMRDAARVCLVNAANGLSETPDEVLKNDLLKIADMAGLRGAVDDVLRSKNPDKGNEKIGVRM